MRALQTLEGLIPDGPHPVGSAANAGVRDRIIGEFARLGLETRIQTRLVCNDEGVCGQVENLLASFPEPAQDPHESGLPGILLVAHYDSVPAGPGAGDDLSGVACLLEVARALAAEAGPEQERVSFLVTDGEEIGLLGAHAFVAHHPWLARIDSVINLEARGSSGPSLLFETGAENSWLMELYAAHAPRPSATSYSVEVYRRMPNDTDFSPFRDRGISGVNFAFIEDSHNYHTANDTVDRLDPRSLQHHGDNVLPLVRAYCAAPSPGPGARGAGDLVYFDLFGRVMVRWRVTWNLPFLLLEAALLALGIARAARTSAPAALRVRRVMLTGLMAIGVLGLAALAGSGIGSLLALRPGPVGALSPFPVWSAYFCATLLVLLLVAGQGGSSLETFCGLALTWLVGAALTTWLAPGATHLFIVPLAPLVIGLLFPPIQRGFASPGGMVLALTVSSFTTLLWSPLLHGLSTAFGLGSGALIVGVMAASAPWLVPIARAVRPPGRRRAALAAALMLVVATAAAMLQERVSPQVPGHVTFHHAVDAAGESASIIVDSEGHGLPPGLGESFEKGVSTKWMGMLSGPSRPAEALPRALPELELYEVETLDSGRLLRVILRSPGGADRTWLRFEPGALAEARLLTSVGDEVPAPVSEDSLMLVGVPEGGLELMLSMHSTEPVTITLVDQYLCPSPEILSLRAACGASYVPRRSGDTILIGTRQIL